MSRPAPQLVPACDRCGRPMHVKSLHWDGIGWICPRCRAGAKPTTNQEELRAARHR